MVESRHFWHADADHRGTARMIPRMPTRTQPHLPPETARTDHAWPNVGDPQPRSCKAPPQERHAGPQTSPHMGEGPPVKEAAHRETILASLAQAHGAARTTALCPTRAERRILPRMISDGTLVSHPGRVVALPDTDWRVVIARRLGGLIGCDHGLVAAGLPVRERPGRGLHVLVPDDPGPAARGLHRVTVHRVPRLPVDPLSSPFATGDDLLLTHLHCADELDALVALDAALRGGMVRRDDLLTQLPGKRNGAVRGVVRRADPRARSLLETIARYDLQEAGIDPEVAVVTEAGELDLLVFDRIDVETDGHQYHSDWADWTHDRFRDQWLLAHGYTVLRLTSQQVMARQTAWVVEQVATRLGCWPTPRAT